MITSDSLRSLRTCGAVTIPRLSPIESAMIDRSYRECCDVLRRVAIKYYRSRADNPHEAAEWLTSEVYTYVIETVIAGKRKIPANEADWLAVVKTIRHRYWESIPIIVDGCKVRFLIDADSSIETRITADRLQLDDQAFTDRLIDYAISGLGYAPDSAPAWLVQTITHWITAPGLTYRERAAELGVKHETVKSREARAKSAVRDGIARRFGGDCELAPGVLSSLCSGCNVAT
jgi:hypothetical protein